MPLKNIFARQVFDSNGNPTVEVDLLTDLGLFRATVPAGTTTGNYEALEIRDNIPDVYDGLGVDTVIYNINNIIGPELLMKNFEPTQQEEIDNCLIELDGTGNKSCLGVNAVLGVSMAVTKAGAARRGVPLYQHIADLAENKRLFMPVPVFNVLNGGTNSGNKCWMKEYLILPTGATTFASAMKMGIDVYKAIEKYVRTKFGNKAVVSEGGFAPQKLNEKQAFKLLKDTINKAGYEGQVEIGLNAAADDLKKDGGKYDTNFKAKKSDPKKWMESDKLLKTYMGFIKKFPIITLEDPFHSEDWIAWTSIVDKTTLQIVGGQLISSQPGRIEMAAEKQACNCFLLKLNQIGTVSEAIKAHKLAFENGMGTMISHRAGDSDETFIADLAVGLSTGQIKAGGPSRAEGLAKYNQLIRIEEELGPEVPYAGRAFKKPIM